MEDERIRQRVVAALTRMAGPDPPRPFKAVISSMRMMMDLRHDVSILGRGIQLGMDLTMERIGYALEMSCPDGLRMFLHQGKHWLVAYNGVPKQISHSAGMAYIVLLLQEPGKEIHVSDLRFLVSGRRAKARLDSRQEMLDQRAIDDYKARLAKVEELLRGRPADDNSDETRGLRAEQAWYKRELKRGATRRGKPKKKSRDVERARKSVSNAVTRAITAIRREHMFLGLHLHEHIDMGEFFIYRGDPSPRWVT